MAKRNKRIIDGPDVWASLLGNHITQPAVKFVDGQFIAKFDEEQPRDERGRFSTTAGSDTVDPKEANERIWDETLSRLPEVVGGHFLSSDNTRSMLKNEVAKNIGANLLENKVDLVSLATPLSTVFARDIEKVMEETPASGTPWQFTVIDVSQGTIINAWMLSAASSNEIARTEYFTREGLIAELDQTGREYIMGGTPEAEQWVAERLSSTYVGMWAETSNDSNAVSLALQNVAETTFGIENAAGWKSDENELADRYATEHGPALAGFLQAQYDATQTFLSEQKVSSLELFRGMTVDERNYSAITTNSSMAQEIQTRPLTSWSTNQYTALSFSERAEGNPIIIQAIIPAERVFSMPATGVGCLNEKEVVVLGGRDNANVLTAKEYRDREENGDDPWNP